LLKVWSRNLPTRFMVLLIAVAFLMPTVLGNVVVFDKYKTIYTLEGDTLRVHKSLRLMNIGANPIIPGEIHFKLSQQQDNDLVLADIEYLEITDHYERKIDSKQVKGQKELDIIFTIWDPLLPAFHYDFQMQYEIEFDPKGILFYEINIPTERTTIKIKNRETDFLLPKRYHITYAPEASVENADGARVIKWTETPNLEFEYSYLPLPRLGIRMVNVFWIILISISLLYLVFRFFKARKLADEY